MNTHFSKNFFILVAIILAVGLSLLYFINHQSSIIPVMSNQGDTNAKVSDTEGQFTQIGEQITIDEENIKGSYPDIFGDSPIAMAARDQIQEFVADITRQANEQLPELRRDFPEAYNDRSYEVEVRGEYFSSDNTESVVLLEYMYTGGANGTSFYVTFNQNNEGEMIGLSDIIPAKKRVAFVQLVKDRLRSDGGSNDHDLGIFDDAVKGITFTQLDRFAVDNETLHIYFDKYEVAPGASGDIVISINDYKSIVNTLPDTDPNNPVFSWVYEIVPHEDYPKTKVSLNLDDGSEVPSTYSIETVVGSCNIVDTDSYAVGDNVHLAENSSPILCYYAGFGRVFRVIELENQYAIQGKNLEEGSPDYTPPDFEFETIINIPKK